MESSKSLKAEEFRAKCDAKFELSTVFKTNEEIEKLKEEVMKKPAAGDEEA